MSTITIKLNERSKAGKTLKEILTIFSKEPGVEKLQEDSPYNPKFVEKIRKSEQQIKEGKYKELNANDIWGGIGL